MELWEEVLIVLPISSNGLRMYPTVFGSILRIEMDTAGVSWGGGGIGGGARCSPRKKEKDGRHRCKLTTTNPVDSALLSLFFWRSGE